ncbi:siderophore-interacting protein [Jidongwangia harbinensis]|uniref:siderophore-interacting protein n=1 Tax=Jidongwangia harbinensis TaxID=2878561 RepID=UPI001CD98973|nr:siderophore-interacting protein [Jidongwangia harbinensis]MCA2215604.1 siderophore-interacting protein [Jidongwangia harbinensis]
MAEDRPFAVRVARVRRLSPVFTRVTLADDDLTHFAAHGFDQRINLLFCDGDRREYTADDWFDRWRAAPDATRPPLRTYTVRSFRPEACELDIDFVVHGDAGPASRWAGRARPGDPLIIIGPVAGASDPAADVAWAPPAAGRLLIAADEAALPAAAAIAEALPPGRPATIVAEVPEPADAVPFDAPDGVTVHFLARSRGESLLPVVRELAGDLFGTAAGRAEPDLVDESDWAVPDPDAAAEGRDYAWLAGEAGTVVALRRFLVGERGVDRRSVAFMGYWRRGQAQPN